MKTLMLVLTSIAALGCLTVDIQAKTYTVKNIGKGGLKSACSRGGGTFADGENSYSCTYGNGNIRECSKRDGHCITETPKIEADPSQDPFGGIPDGMSIFN